MIRSVVRTYQSSFAGFPGPVWVLAGAALVNRCGTMVLAYMALYLTRTKGLDASEAGMILGAYGIGAMVGGLGAGWLCDRISAKAVQVGSLLLNGLGFLILGQVASDLGILLMMFAIAVVSEGFRPANATALAQAAPIEVRTRAFALLRLAVNLGMAIGPTVGGFLAERAGAANRGKYMGLYHLSFALAYALAPVIGTWAYQHVDPDAVWYGALVIGAICAGLTAMPSQSKSMRM